MATYVLVHGAYQGLDLKPVVDRPRGRASSVCALLDGCAERHHLVRTGITVATHAQEIAQLMFYEDPSASSSSGRARGAGHLQAAELARDRIARLRSWTRWR
jgi:hypothetical protein